MTQPEPRARYAWPSGGIMDFVLAVLLETVSSLICAATIYIIIHFWYVALAGFVPNVATAIFLVVVVGVLIRYAFSTTVAEAVNTLRNTFIWCVVALLISGLTEFISTNLTR